MVSSTDPTASPLSRKRTERFSPSPGDDRPSDSKKLRALVSSRSFAEDLKAKPANNIALAGPHIDVIGKVDCKQALVFQLVDSGMRVLVIVQNLGGSVQDFLRRQQVMAMCLAELAGGKYLELNEDERLSHNQTEFIIDREDLIIQPSQGQWKFADSVPLRILSFDIETNVPLNNTFPNPRNDSAIQIGNIVQEKGDTTRSYRVIFTLDGCSAIAGAEVRSFQTETAMLSAWRQFLLECDPDIVTGHNIACFDFMYLITRAKMLGIHDFACLGRLKDRNTEVVEQLDSSGWQHAPVLPGRLQFDTLQYFKQRGKDVGCSLNTLAARYLGSNKESDVDYTIINRLQGGTNDDRRRLAVYCLKDCDLVLRLLFSEQNMCIEEAVTAARQSKSCRPFGSFLS
ncbi:DNA polymerase [Favolaschia claudopus]|uniref:DNA polymerase delta catalytic subunit n=1 Tax=Favolaschia claudopus TaxID=2862362 RepID=A0AAW0B8U0_9AGAR